MICPLCKSTGIAPFHRDGEREYHQCDQCKLVFVPPPQHLSPTEEKSRYELHENNPQDKDYRQFLSRLFTPLCKRVKLPAKGLDFGSGPGPTLSLMFKDAGYEMEIFDLYYANKPEVIRELYDFISCTEVAEHLREPGKTISDLLAILRPGGWLGFMTKMVINQEAFSLWHYKNDPTHVCFFSKDTFKWLANHHHCRIEFEGKDVILLQKKTHSIVQPKQNRPRRP